MGVFYSWIQDNWFSLLQGAGIIGGLFFTAISIRKDTRARRVSDLLELSSLHRELWNEVYRTPALSRIFDPSVDLVANPITPAEENFLLIAIVHFSTGYQLASQGSVLSASVLREDVRWFFSLPIPRAVWEASKRGRDQRFLKFVDDAMKDTKLGSL